MSYRISESFFNATQNRETLITVVVIETQAGKYVFHAGHLTRNNLPADPVLELRKSLVSVGGLTETLIPNVTDIYANYTQTEQTQCQVTLDDSDEYFSFYLSTDTFLGGTLTIKIGYPSVAYADMLQLFRGTVDDEHPINGQLQVQATADGSILRQSHVTGRASRYSNPRNADDVLPIVYGAHYDPNRPQGVWTCPCIDTVNGIYLVCDGAVLSTAKGNQAFVYVNGTPKTTGVTFTPSGADENGKTIAYLTFSPLLADNDVVTIQCAGKVDASGNLIQHPLDIIKDIITYAGGTVNDFDATNFNQEYFYAQSRNLMAGGILTHQSRLVQELVLEILGSFMASSWVSGQDDVKISFLRESVSQSEIALFLGEATCSDYDIDRLRANICNQATFDLIHDTAHDGVLYPNYSPYNIDCDPTVGSQYIVMSASDSWLLSSDPSASGVASLWVANQKTGATTLYNYTGSAGRIARMYFQLSDGSRKRVLWSNSTDGSMVLWTLDSAYAFSSFNVVLTLGANWICSSYWHNGTTGKLLCFNSSTYETRLYTLNSSDASTGYVGLGTVTGYYATAYSRLYSNRIRIAFRRVSDGLVNLWTINSSDVYVSAKTFPAYTGYTPRGYWHNGTEGRLYYHNTTNGALYQRILDASDNNIANVADMAGAPAITSSKLSQSRHGVHKRNFDGGWMSSVNTPIPLMRALYAQYGTPKWVVGFTTTDTRAMYLERGDLIAFSCDTLRDENALPLVNQIGRVLEIDRNPIEGTSWIKVLDTGAYYTGSGTTRDRTRF